MQKPKLTARGERREILVWWLYGLCCQLAILKMFQFQALENDASMVDCTLADDEEVASSGFCDRGLAGSEDRRSLDLDLSSARPNLATEPQKHPTSLAGGVKRGIAQVLQNTTYHFQASDVLRCQTIHDSIVVMVRGILENDTTICLGGVDTLHAVGNGPVSWTWAPSGSSTANPLLAAPHVSTTYVLNLPFVAGGCNVDSVRVNVLPFACCYVPGVPIWHNDSSWQHPNISSGTYHIIDTLFVDGNWTIANATFWMDAGAVIFVAPNVSFNTTNCTFLPACPEMWGGIKLAAGTSRYYSLRDNFVSAVRGVWSVWGSQFRITKSTFRGCWVGVYVLGQGNNPHLGSIEGCNFLASQMLPPFANQNLPWAGVQLDHVNGFRLGRVGGGTNRFDRLQHGLYSDASTAEVCNNDFMFMAEGTALPQVAPWNVGGVGRGTGAGVRSGITGGIGNIIFTPSLRVGHFNSIDPDSLMRNGNRFTSCNRGVFASDGHSVRVRGNTMSLNTVGTFITRLGANRLLVEWNNHSRDSLAIYAGNTTNMTGRISDNTITGPASFFYNGIRCGLLFYSGNTLTLPGVFPLAIFRNTINLRGNAIWLEVCRQINVEGNNITLQPQFMGEAMSGITVNAEARNRINQNTILGNQVGQADTLVAGIDVFASGQTIVTCNKSRSVGRHVVFQGPCLGSDFLGNDMTDGVDGVVWRLLGRTGQQGTANFPSDNQWFGTFTTGQTQMVSSIWQDSRLFVRSGFPWFPTSAATGASTAPTQPQPSNNLAGSFPCTTMTVISPKPTAIQSLATGTIPSNAIDSAMKYRANEWAYEALLVDSILLATDTSMQNYFSTVDPTDQGAVSRANELIIVPDTVSAIMESANIHASNLILDNHKDVQDLRLDNGVIDSVELAKLLLIAGQCEELGGKAVNIARSVLASEGIFIWVNPVCRGIMPPVKKQLNDNEEVSSPVRVECWPNPTDGTLFLKFSDLAIAGTLSVIDAHGHTLLEHGFEFLGTPIVLDVHRFSQGLLMVRAVLVSGEIFSWRIVLER